MQIILLADIPGFGKKFDVKEVHGGYARNFLFPRGLAKEATTESLKELASARAKHEEEELALKKHLEVIAERVQGKTLAFDVRTDETGVVFGSVTKEMIIRALREQSFITKERVGIVLEHPLKVLGVHDVGVDFRKGVRVRMKIMLLRQP